MVALNETRKAIEWAIDADRNLKCKIKPEKKEEMSGKNLHEVLVCLLGVNKVTKCS